MEIKKIKAIVELIKDSNINEIEITDGEQKIKISCGVSQANFVNPPIQYVPAPQLTSAAQPAVVSEPVKAEVVAVSGHRVKSPMVGTFYSASSPSNPPYVKVGDTVKVGQTLCIIEAMKLMNHIESDKDGVIKEILLKDGAPVEYGQALFVVA